MAVVDSDLLRRRQRVGWFVNEALGMSAIGGVENSAMPFNRVRRQINEPQPK
jgi:hypothetical protein